MNIFHIPSWYPSVQEPFAGIFTKAYIHASAEQYPEHKHIVSCFASSSIYISPRNCFKDILMYARTKSSYNVEVFSENIEYQFTPKTVALSTRLPFKWIQKVIDINENVLKKSIQKYGKIDLIHAHVTYPGGCIAHELSKKYNIPFIITEHYGPFPQPGLSKKAILDKDVYSALVAAKSIVGVSNHLVDSIRKFGDFNTVLIPNMIDEDFFKIQPQQNKPKDNLIFYTQCLMNGNRKGIDILIRAIKEIHKQYPNIEFRIGGTGSQLEYYQKIATDLSVKITWLGRISKNQLLEEYNLCDCFILTSYHENFGIVFAEANACGKPVIATKCGGPEDIVTDANGILIETGNIKAATSAIIQFIENKESYDPEKIRKLFLLNFSKKVVLKRYHELYKKTV